MLVVVVLAVTFGAAGTVVHAAVDRPNSSLRSPASTSPAPLDTPVPTAIAQRIAVPSYINPTVDPEAWLRLSSSIPGSVGLAVVNVINGPDYVQLDEWASAIQSVSANGTRVIGYVDTGYLGTTGQRTRLGSTNPVDWISQIQHDIALWYRFYGPGLTGIFFDQTQNACGPTEGSNSWADLYTYLGNEVKRTHAGAVTVLNPGIGVPQCYETAGDVIVTFEGSAASYLGVPGATLPFTPLSWDPVDPNKLWHIVYDAPDAATMAAVVNLSKTRSAGWVYVTDDVMANPYDTLPPADYWAAEQAVATVAPGPIVPPSRPDALDTVEVTGVDVTLDWVASKPGTAPVVAYDIYRDGVLIGSAPGDTVTYTAIDLTPLTTYTFQVVARDAFGATGPPARALVVETDETYGDPRRAPVGVTATEITPTSARLSWATVSEDTSQRRPANADYVVLKNGVEVLRLPGDTATVIIGGLAPNASYTFSVYGIDASGDPTQSSTAVLVTTAALPDGQTIVNTSVVESPDQISFSADFLVPFAFRRVFIATGDPALPCWSTGSIPQICADYLLENERLLRYTGSGGEWDWAVVRDASRIATGTTSTWIIRRTDIGSPMTSVAVFNANGYAPNTYCGIGFLCTSTGPPLPYD
ncbi:MAG: spherulation-specific family 4 protein [Ilumatobacteraceae bacterium]